MKLGTTNKRRMAAPVATLGLLILTLALAASPAQAAAGPQLTADKSSGLDASGQTVTVTGSGFSPSTGLYLALCDPAVPRGGACDLANFKQVSTDGKGAFTASIKLVAMFGTTDCTKVACALVTNEPANPRNTTNVVALPVAFAGSAPTSAAPEPTTPPASPPATNNPSTQAAAADNEQGPSVVIIVVAALVVVALLAGLLLLRKRRAGQG